jgi:6-phospho-3-hexuloisomerase
MDLHSGIDLILHEINGVLRQVDEQEITDFVDELLAARRIIVFGVGRMGLVSKAFTMRLRHLGLEAYALGECTTPQIGPGDLLLISSGSGETQTVYDVALLGKSAHARLATITAHPESRIGRLSDRIVKLAGPTKIAGQGSLSIQPMTTLTDQSLFILFDAIILIMMEKTGQQSEDLWERHNNLE